MTRQYRHVAALATAFMVAAAPAAHAAWPDDQPIEILVGFAPGGANDVMPRMMAPFMEKLLGGNAKFVVVNRPGASGDIAWSQLARAKPDGYTIAMMATPAFLTNQIRGLSSYDAAAIVPVARAMDDPAVLVAGPRTKFDSLAEAARFLAGKPEQLSLATNGVGTNGDMVARSLAAAGVKLNVVPFKGAGDIRTSLSGGHIDLAVMGATEYLSASQGDSRLRAIAQFSPARRAFLDKVPTAKEQGYDIAISSERGFAAPRGVPPEILSKLEYAIQATLRNPDFLAKVQDQAPTILFQSGADWARRMPQQKAFFSKIWEATPDR
ncbi:tripartite tricarboxylate transporter substrate binding protein [Pigmentiphaga soli]|uniref:Tripartite tricarboxylate transporter substrate binding protein n=1 Tax=Pigmentiphaga soli TaxID=1007095 RepID=A0ABP8HSB1_9BURK